MDSLAPHLSRRRTIGLLTARLRDPYATVIWTGVMDAARERDVNVINLVGARLHCPDPLEAPAQVLFDLVDPGILDGLVVFSEMLYHFSNPREVALSLARFAGLPMTSIGALEGTPSVLLDLEEGMRRMVAHLAEAHGYRRLAYLSGPAHEETAEALYRGYLRGLAEHGMPFDSRLVTPNPPAWGQDVGRAGVRVLLDERRLRPGADFDCIVGCADLEVQAFESLEARGIRVPYDVAVTGFNNLEAARLGYPSLTTVDRKIADRARLATAMLLDLLDGKPVPERVFLPPELVVRRSCGCMPAAVSQAASASPRLTQAAGALAGQRGAIVAATRARMEQRAAPFSGDAGAKQAEQLVDAFLADLTGDAGGGFLRALEELLSGAFRQGADVAGWHNVISALRDAARPLLEGETPARAEDLWQQARVLIGDFAERGQGRRRLDAAQQFDTLSDITRALITTFDVAELTDILARELPRLGIPGGCLSLYENATAPEGGARLLLAYDERGPLAVDPRKARFAAGLLAPPALLPQGRRFDLVALPLYFQNEQLGIVALEMGPREGSLYEAVRIQISSALKGALLAMRNVELYHEAVAARQAAEAANDLKSRFLSTVSHELRTPLSLIVGTIEMLLRQQARQPEPLPAPFDRDLRSIRTGSQHLARLISDVLDLASSQAGELHLALEPLNLREVLAEADLLGESMAREKGLAWQCDLPADLPVIWGDATRLRQVALNLISNAVKFTERGYVRLWAEASQQQVVVAVSDSGIGIPTAEQDVIFDEFRQSERTAQRGYGGMGLGLAVSRRLIELHRGKIGVLSSGADGSGSTFYFTLPVAAASTIAPPRVMPASAAGAGHAVILTERAGNAGGLAEQLAERGFAAEIIVLEEEPFWLNRVSAAAPDAVILDYEPVAERGWELAQALHRNPLTQDIPVLFCAFNGNDDRGAVLELDVLSKPLASDDLARALARQGFGHDDLAPGRRILVVDDEPGILQLHTRLLQELAPKCLILSARNGREALELMARERPDLVLLDLMMPELDGFGVLQAMRQHAATRDVPVIVLTAQILTAAEMARLQKGVAAVLNKGLYTGAEVLAQVSSALRRNKGLSGETQRVVRQAMAYIHEHYAEDLSRHSLAAAVGWNERYLTQCFRRETGLTPIAYLTRYRIRQAKALLESGEMNVTEVAFATGFSDSGYFTRVFRAEVGVPPRAYQRGERAAHPAVRDDIVA